MFWRGPEKQFLYFCKIGFLRSDLSTKKAFLQVSYTWSVWSGIQLLWEITDWCDILIFIYLELGLCLTLEKQNQRLKVVAEVDYKMLDGVSTDVMLSQ